MKISAQDEYGLRILIRIASSGEEDGLSIPQLSEAEGLSTSYVAKLTRTLRMAGLIESNRGHKGGYVLARSPEEIKVREVLKSLGGMFFDDEFCGSHSGQLQLCSNSTECSVRSLWRVIQHTVDQLLDQVTIADLVVSEEKAHHTLQQILEDQVRIPQMKS